MWDEDARSLSLSPSQAYKLLSMIDKSVINSNHKIKPEDVFRCTIEYNDNYYEIALRVDEPSLLEGESYGVIRITEGSYNNIKTISTYPNSLELWHPFNGNVKFVNELGDKVRVIVYYNDQVHDSFSLLPNSESMRIGYYVSDIVMGFTDRAVLTYSILPHNIQGSIIVNRYPQCMDEEQARMLFGLVGVNMKFPRYLPQGYEYECTVHVFNTIAYTYYSNEEIRRLDEIIHHTVYESKAFMMVIYKYLSYDERMGTREYYEYIKQNYDPAALFLTINGSESIAYRFRNINIISVYHDDHVYTIKGIVSIEELMKIAQSLV